eukprot:CAMPEP_0205819576 /NCGR_PEP_ID=MMETSP0206-20130828/2019_1 /ASSEMBLY_ACC=CAM_ASM_000279 /TAXON_ID=36767 /ORGANISM="Euplotes focardii, Strain TN1" /LENGTH=212 /DNA_ID=CAMNT_0053113353 /DNA_START=38 /DNA_END=673 /DNA_ORIENTATION=+
MTLLLLCACLLVKSVAPAAGWSTQAKQDAAHSGLETCTLFEADHANDQNGMVLFDLNVSADAVRIESLDMNLGATPTRCFVYHKTGTYLGFESTPGAWRLAAVSPVTESAGINNATNHDIAPDLYLSKGVHGILLNCQSVRQYYRLAASNNTVYPGEHFSLHLGTAADVLFGDDLRRSRVWNGCVHYYALTEPPTSAPPTQSPTPNEPPTSA